MIYYSSCDSDSRWAAGQSIRPQSFVIKVVPEVMSLRGNEMTEAIP